MMTGPPELGERRSTTCSRPGTCSTGATATYALLAAERHRRDTGTGQEVRVPLGDVAMATLGNLGQIAEVATSGADRPRFGNTLYGSFGRDFVTADGHARDGDRDHAAAVARIARGARARRARSRRSSASSA